MGLDHNSAYLVQSRRCRSLAEYGLARANPHELAGLGRICAQGRFMYAGKLVFAQLTDHLQLTIFRQCVQRYGGHQIKSFTCLDQLLYMTFA